MWNLMRSRPRVAATSAATVIVVGGLLSASSAVAADDLPYLTIQAPMGDEVAGRVVESTPFGFGVAGDGLFVFDEAGGMPAGVEVFLVDTCRSAGAAWLMGTNGTGGPLDVRLDLPESGSGIDLEAATSFVRPLEWSCDQLHPPRASRLPKLGGSAAYHALGRGCSDFDAPVELVESKPGRGPDIYTLSGQRNRAIHAQPFIAVDTSKVFDEVHLIMLPDPDDPTVLAGVAIGGPQGSLPKGKKLDRAIDALFADQSQGLAEDLVRRANAGKAPKALLDGLKIKGKPCTYAIDIDLKGRSQAEALLALREAMAMPGPGLDSGDRFSVDVEWADGASTPIPPARLFGSGSGSGSGDVGGVASAGDDPGAWFFDPAAPDLLVSVLDGCADNGHFWVFSAATTDVAYTLEVIDSQTGGIYRGSSGLDGTMPSLVDTEAFATCP